jgi:hypothetical protein
MKPPTVSLRIDKNRHVIDKNRHVRDYLAYYTALPYAPRHAVLINGPWGVGKTYLVKAFLQQHVGQDKKYIYISLYGLTTIDEIEAALFQAIYPALGWQVTKLGARVGKTLLRRIGLDPGLKAGELINKLETDLYVFDDLERCEAPINKVLGYINEFVEHDGSKVIIVANESEISDHDEYCRRREKLIGKTLEIQSAFDEAFTYFISLISDRKTRELFEKKAAEIASIYQQSGLNNLRILQQTMWDFERFFRVLTDTHRGNDEAMTVLLRLLFVLSFELKAGRIRSADLESRTDKMVATLARRDGEDSTDLAQAGQRYPEIGLNNSIVSDELLVDVLVKGIIDEDAIRSSVDKSRYFVTPAAEPAWRTVWHWFERTDDEFAVARDRMERQFAAREFSVTGEILHVFGLRLFLSGIGVLSKSRAEVVREGKKYIDDLYAKPRVSAPLTNEADEVRFGGYGGLAVQENETPEYRELLAYLQQKMKRAAENSYPERGLALLKEMASDPQLYIRRLCLTSSEDNIYYEIPILASIDADLFVSSLLSLHPAHQRIIMMVFKSRYAHGSLGRELAPERQWLATVCSKLVKKAHAMPPIGRYRLLSDIESSMVPALDASRASDPAARS